MSRIGPTFQRLGANGEAGLVAYVTAGHPSPDRTASIVWALERGGADIVELGVPFSDPIADGPVIQHASDRAIAAGTTLSRVLGIARQIREKSQIPIVLFSYLNPLLRYGFDRLATDAVAAGIDGVLMTDLSVEEAQDWVPGVNAAGLDTIFLVAPTSTPRRLELVSKFATGFVYLVSRTGVTGARETLSDSIAPLVEGMRRATSKPLAVGFGISKPQQAGEVGRIADAVVVGSAIVRMIEEHASSQDLEARLERFIRDLKEPLRRSAQ
jgi:tryptophan synthase alpha chain